MSITTVSDVVPIGVGFDTARYGHHVSFLRADLQPATRHFTFLESRKGYRQLYQALERLAAQHEGRVHFHVRVDAAGQYATNLERFLRSLPFPMTFSVGQPMRNKEYRKAHFPKRKSDAVESLACARFAIVERPPPTPPLPEPWQVLREVISRLQAKVRQATRLINQLHNLLSRVFPELALLANDLSAGWVLELLHRYPTADKIAHARLESLAAIPFLTPEMAQSVQEAARDTVGSVRGELIESLVRDQVRNLRDCEQAKNRLEKLVEKAYRALPPSPHVHVESILGIGTVTAAVLVSKIVSIDRFPTPESLVGYFGVFPEEATSGVDKRGRPVPPGTMLMSRQGNDLVRRYLWMAAWSALQRNPAAGELYARLRGRGRRGDVAQGHVMRKLLHQVFAVWKSGKPFDPEHRRPPSASCHPPQEPESPAPAAQKKTAGRKTGTRPAKKAVTAAPTKVESAAEPINSAPPPAPSWAPDRSSQRVDFASLRRRVTIAQVLRCLGVLDQMRGGQVQRRGPCPIHGDAGRRCRSFSVNLQRNVFQCFHPPCGAHGNVLDLWAAVRKLPLREAALDLKNTFNL
jgi:transposase